MRVIKLDDGTYQAEHDRNPEIRGYGRTIGDAIKSAETEWLMYEDYHEGLYTRGRPCDEEGIPIFFDTDE